MELSVARSLIQNAIVTSATAQSWADLGAGEGLFADALSTLLPPGSDILAVDKDQVALNRIRLSNQSIRLAKHVGTFETLPVHFLFDGILMANALHYVKNQAEFLVKLKESHLKSHGVIVLVEYNLSKRNPWVPYPIDKTKLQKLSDECGFRSVAILSSTPSKLNASEIYSAMLKP